MPTSRPAVSRCALAALVPALAFGTPTAAQPPAGAPTIQAVAPAPVDELLMLVTVNAETAEEAEVVLRTADGRWWLSEESLARWRLVPRGAGARLFSGIRHFALDALPGVTVTHRPRSDRLVIEAPAAAFEPSELASSASQRAAPTPPSPGGFLNYEWFASHAAGEDSFAGQFEAGLFARDGVFVTSALAQRGGGERGMVRLESTWTTDFPSGLASLRIGDAIGVPGAWGRAVRFGGVQYATNFGAQPGFVTFPELTASGQAALPSTVDVFVNNALVAERKVPPGPFSITHVPTTTGGGQVELVVRDLFGREQVITQRFYASADLLAPGLAQFAYEAGFERRDFGLSSNDYGAAFASATYRMGVRDDLTVEARGEAARDRATAGAAAVWLWRGIGTLNAAMAASTSGDGRGALGSIGINREIERFSLVASTQWTSERFRQTGSTRESPLPRQQTSAALGYQFGAWGSANAAYVRQAYRAQPGAELASLGYTAGVLRRAVVSVAAIRAFGRDGSRAMTATLSMPWGERDLASAGFERTADRNGVEEAGTLSLQRNLPAGEGYGYRVRTRGRGELQAGLSYQNDVGMYAIEVARVDGRDGVRASAAGGIGVVGGRAFLARPLTESFGVVRVDDYPDVRVLLDNHVVAVTGPDGYAVLPRLRAYDRNRVSIDQRDVPLDAAIDALAIEAVPYFRSGVRFDFPVRHAHGATLRVTLDDGDDLPAGAYIEIDDRPERFPVAGQGVAYLTGITGRHRLHATWRAQRCDIDVALPPSRDPLPDLGTLTCHGVAR